MLSGLLSQVHLRGVGVVDLVWGHDACSVLEWEKGHKGLGNEV